MFPTWGARGTGLSSSGFWSAEEEKIDLLKAKWSIRGMLVWGSVGFYLVARNEKPSHQKSWNKDPSWE